MEKDKKIYTTKIDQSVNDYCYTIGIPKNKSKMTVGNTIIFNTIHFNWLQKKMWKIFFNITIEDVED